MRLENRGRVRGGDLFDLHPTELGRHHHREAGGPVQHDAEVELALDRQSLLHQHLANDLPLGPGLLGHQLHAQDLTGRLDRSGRIVDQFDTTSLATPARMHLSFDHNSPAQLVSGSASSLSVSDEYSPGNRHDRSLRGSPSPDTRGPSYFLPGFQPILQGGAHCARSDTMRQLL